MLDGSDRYACTNKVYMDLWKKIKTETWTLRAGLPLLIAVLYKLAAA